MYKLRMKLDIVAATLEEAESSLGEKAQSILGVLDFEILSAEVVGIEDSDDLKFTFVVNSALDELPVQSEPLTVPVKPEPFQEIPSLQKMYEDIQAARNA